MGAVAYADDVVLFASSRVGLNDSINRFVNRAARVSLTLGIAKWVTAGLRWLGKEKKVIGDMTPFVVRGEQVSFLTWTGLCKYLGAEFGLRGTTKWAGARMVDDLRKLSAAYLKPQQMMMLLRAYLIPKCYYHLLH